MQDFLSDYFWWFVGAFGVLLFVLEVIFTVGEWPDDLKD